MCRITNLPQVVYQPQLNLIVYCEKPEEFSVDVFINKVMVYATDVFVFRRHTMINKPISVLVPLELPNISGQLVVRITRDGEVLHEALAIYSPTSSAATSSGGISDLMSIMPVLGIMQLFVAMMSFASNMSRTQ